MLVNAAAGMAVPLVVGIWSDRLARSGRGRRMPFILGGALVTAGGLVAIALGSSSSYLVLGALRCRRLRRPERRHDCAPRVDPGSVRRLRSPQGDERPGARDAGGRPARPRRRRRAHRPRHLGALRAHGRARPAARPADDPSRDGARGSLADDGRRSGEPDFVLPPRGATPRRPRLPARADPLGARLRRASGLLPALRGRGARARAERRVALARGVRARNRHGDRPRRPRRRTRRSIARCCSSGSPCSAAASSASAPRRASSPSARALHRSAPRASGSSRPSASRSSRR